MNERYARIRSSPPPRPFSLELHGTLGWQGEWLQNGGRAVGYCWAGSMYDMGAQSNHRPQRKQTKPSASNRSQKWDLACHAMHPQSRLLPFQSVNVGRCNRWGYEGPSSAYFLLAISHLIDLRNDFYALLVKILVCPYSTGYMLWSYTYIYIYIRYNIEYVIFIDSSKTM